MPILRQRVLLIPNEELPKELMTHPEGTSRRFAIQDHIDGVLTRGNPRMSQPEKDFIIKYEMKHWRSYEKTINAQRNRKD
jgi:hypothetical protein